MLRIDGENTERDLKRLGWVEYIIMHIKRMIWRSKSKSLDSNNWQFHNIYITSLSSLFNFDFIGIFEYLHLLLLVFLYICMLVNKHACVIIIHITSPYTLFQYSCPVFGYEMTCLLDQIESDISRSRSRHVHKTKVWYWKN